MKPFFAIILALLFTLCSVFCVSAEEAQYQNAFALYQDWCQNLPDYFCGAWLTDDKSDHMTFAIQDTEAGNAGKLLILDLIKDDSSVTFIYQEYSQKYLSQILKEIYYGPTTRLGIGGGGINTLQNCVFLEVAAARKEDPETQARLREITEKYGNAVQIKYVGSIYIEPDVDPNPQIDKLYPQRDPISLPLMTCVIAVVVLSVCFVFGLRRKQLLLQTKGGTVTTPAALPTVKEVERMVKQANCSVSSELDQKIMDAIGKD